MEHLGRLAENHGVLSASDEPRVFVRGRPDTSVVKSADMPILEDLADQRSAGCGNPTCVVVVARTTSFSSHFHNR
jgi:hypothetical protein